MGFSTRLTHIIIHDKFELINGQLMSIVISVGGKFDFIKRRTKLSGGYFSVNKYGISPAKLAEEMPWNKLIVNLTDLMDS